MEENNQQGQQGQENGNNKELKKYQNNLDTLMGILAGDEKGMSLLKRKTADNDLVDKVVARLVKETDEAFEEKLLKAIQSLVEKEIEVEDKIAAKRRELDQLELQTKKGFNEESAKVYNLIKDRNAMKDRYRATLSQAKPGSVTEETTDESLHGKEEENV